MEGTWRWALGHKSWRRGGAAEKKQAGGKEEVEQARGRGRRPAGEEVNRFFAWELCPRREFQSCHWGRHTAHTRSANGDFTCLSGDFFSLWFPHPAGQGDIYSPFQRPTPSPSSRKQPPCPECWSPFAAPPGGDPQLHFSEEETEAGLRGGRKTPPPYTVGAQ